MKACRVNSTNGSSSSSSNIENLFGIWSRRILPLLALWCVLGGPIAIEASPLSSPIEENAAFHRKLSGNDDDSTSYEEPNKYHPGKKDVGCEFYYNPNANYSNSPSSENNGNRERRTQNLQSNGNGVGGGTGNNNYSPGAGNGYNQWQMGQSNGVVPPCRDMPPPPSDDSQAELDERALSTVVLNVSLALPKPYQNGIPNRLTTVVKEYFRHPIIMQAFHQRSYDNGTHFELRVWKVPSPPLEEDDGSEDDPSKNNDQNNNGRQLQQQPNNNNSSNYTNSSSPVIGLVALRDDDGFYLGDIPDTKYAWVVHSVYLVAHVGEPSQGGGQLLKDTQVMDWLRRQLQDLIYQDILLEGPLGPYYDINNVYHDSENYDQRQISFLEWKLQEYGIPIAGIAPPGQELWQAPIAHPPFSSDSSRDDDEEVFDHAIHTNIITTRQYMGMACLIVTVVTTLTLSLVSNHVAKRREQEELWGNNLRMMQSSFAKEEADYLNVGWRFGPEQQQQGTTTGIMTMEIFDKRGVGYREGSSVLMGGYEYRPRSQISTSMGQEQEKSSNRSLTLLPATSYG